MRLALLVIAAGIVVAAGPPASAVAGRVALRNGLPLTRLALVTDLDAPPDPDDPGTGGGFNTSTFFQTKLANVNAVAACSDAIEGATAAWAKANGLSRALREGTRTTLELHYVGAGLPGLFAVSYEVKELVRAQVRVDFFRLDGAEQAPEGAPALIEPFRIADLQDGLDKALLCKGASP